MSLLFDDEGNVPWNMPKPLVNAERGAVRVERDRDYESTVSGRILSRLRSSPGEWVHSEELRLIYHRFSACFHTLRSDGHEIAMRKAEGGGFEWLWVSFTPRPPVTDEDKDAYYLSDHWKQKRKERLDFDGWQCCWCKTRDDLQVHHWRYELFAESIGDLMTLCDTCHEYMHELTQVHFPRTVSQEIKQRLLEVSQCHN